MALFEGKTPSERNKLIAAIVLGVLALAALSYMFFGGSSSSPQRTANNNNNRRPGTTQTTTTTVVNTRTVPTPNQVRQEDELAPPRVINWQVTPPAVPEAGRNIFAFYVPPPKPSPTPPPPPSPSPPPPPTLVLSSISPTNVYARTGDFTLQVTGDKFTPAVRIYVGDAELATRFVSPQQLSANVPAPLIGYEGARQVSVRNSDGTLFSNPVTLNVMAAPIPNYSFVGIIGDKRYSDTAILKDKNTKQLLNVQRGDMVGGRFRVTSISEREVWLTDTSIHIKHTLAFEGGEGNRGSQPPYQPPVTQPRRAEEPEESDETP
jgi:IPT/TIG domain